jgi:hypothetical protein
MAPGDVLAAHVSVPCAVQSQTSFRALLPLLPPFLPSSLFILFLVAGCGPALVWEGRTPDRREWVRVVEGRDGQRVEVGERSGRWYGGVGIDDLAWSHDGRHLAYPARAGQQWTVVLDGRELGRWSSVGELRFAPAGDGLAFAVERDGRFAVAVGEATGPWLDGILADTLAWSATGAVLVYAGFQQGFAHVVWNGRLGPAFDGLSRLVLGARGTRLLYAGRRADRWHVVDGDRVGPPYARIAELALSPDQAHAAYVWIDGAREGLVVDGDALPPFEGGHVSDLSVDEAGRPTFVATRTDGACVVRRGVAQPVAAQIDHLSVTAADRYAYAARAERGWVVLIDGQARASGDAVEELVASPDGRRFVCLLRRGAKWVLGCDASERAFDRVVAGSLAWSRDSRHFGAIAGQAGSRRIFISVDGSTERPLDLREIVLAAEKQPGAPPAEAARVLQAIVAAEVELATGGAPSTDPPRP